MILPRRHAYIDLFLYQGKNGAGSGGEGEAEADETSD